MGYQTVFMVLNDASTNVKEHPDQVAQNVYEGMTGGYYYDRDMTFAIGNYANPMMSLQPDHADTPQLILAYQNMLVRLGYNSNLKDNIALRKQFLEAAKAVIKQEERMIKELELSR